MSSQSDKALPVYLQDSTGRSSLIGSSSQYLHSIATSLDMTAIALNYISCKSKKGNRSICSSKHISHIKIPRGVRRDNGQVRAIKSKTSLVRGDIE